MQPLELLMGVNFMKEVTVHIQLKKGENSLGKTLTPTVALEVQNLNVLVYALYSR